MTKTVDTSRGRSESMQFTNHDQKYLKSSALRRKKLSIWLSVQERDSIMHALLLGFAQIHYHAERWPYYTVKAENCAGLILCVSRVDTPFY